MSTPSHWKLAFVMPNLQLQTSFDFDGIGFVPNQDARLTEIRSNNRAAALLLDGFRDHGGGKLSPGAVIYITQNSFKDVWSAIVDARNCLALACACNGWQLSVGQPNNFLIRDTDYFDFYPRWPSDDGTNFVYFGPALELVAHANENFRAQPSAFISPSGFFSRPQPDEDLWTALFQLWQRHHVTGRRDTRSRRLFRSLSVAYEACRVPQAMYTPIYDHGKHCSLWVSAFETLAHPGGKRRVSIHEVLDLLEKRNLNHNRLRRRTNIKIAGTKSRSINVVQKLYLRLYRARNAFLHGNSLSLRTFAKGGLASGIRLLDIAR